MRNELRQAYSVELADVVGEFNLLDKQVSVHLCAEYAFSSCFAWGSGKLLNEHLGKLFGRRGGAYIWQGIIDEGSTFRSLKLLFIVAVFLQIFIKGKSIALR